MRPAAIVKSFLMICLLTTLSACSSSKNVPMGETIDQFMEMESSPEEPSARQRSEEQPADKRMIAYTASIDLSVKNPEETGKMLLARVNSSNGFLVKETKNSVTARIPAEKLNDYLEYAKTLGRVDDESKTGTDITDQYRDNVIRLNNLKRLRERYLELLAKATDVADILNIEKELERTSTNIEIMEGRIKYAEQSVAYSSVTVRFREKTTPGPVGWVVYGLYCGVKWLFVWN